MLSIRRGNIFTSECATLVNAVNCVGVMGAGIALEFKFRYPVMFDRYEQQCRSGRLQIGKLWSYRPQPHEGRWSVLNFPTKKHWRHPSREEYLRQGLRNFVETWERRGITSIAFPLLGADRGGLDERRVVELMVGYLYRCELPVEIWRYDASADDDILPSIRARLEGLTDREIVDSGLMRRNQLAAVRRAFSHRGVHSLGQLAGCRGIGEGTLENLLKLRDAGAAGASGGEPGQQEMFGP